MNHLPRPINPSPSESHVRSIRRGITWKTLPALIAMVAVGAFGVACEKKAAPSANTQTPDKGHSHTDGDGHDHDHDDGHDHDTAHGGGHEHGKLVDLGSQPAGVYTVKLTRYGSIESGKECSVDIAVTVPEGSPAVSAIRLWYGTENAEGSMKSKAEPEGANHHAHVEIPNPIPAGSKFWVQIENAKGETSVASFDPKAAG